MTALRVVFARRATRDVERIDAWWRENRPAAPDLFVDEVRRAVMILALNPHLGTPAASPRTPGLRRALLERTKYHLYFRVKLDRLEVAAVWHAARGRLPSL